MTKAQERTIAWEREQIARAVSFAAYLFAGRGKKYHENGLALLEAAEAKAAEFERIHDTNGRKALVYAVTPEGWSIQISPDNRPTPPSRAGDA